MWYLGEDDQGLMDEEDIHEELFNLELKSDEKIKSLDPLEHAISESRKLVSGFLNENKCECLIPESGKIVVLDTTLPVKSALLALEENNIKSAPLWDSTKMDYVGIITVSDFIEILLHFHNQVTNVDVFKELENHQIKTWREIISQVRKGQTAQLIYADPDDTLYEAIQILLKNRIHRLPIIDRAESNTILHIITHYRILSYIVELLKEKPATFSFTISELGIGTYKNVVTVFQDTPIHVVLTLLAERKISALPVIDENGTVIDIYSRSDVTALVKQISFDFLDKSIGEILSYKKKEKIHTFLKTETLGEVIDRLIQTRVYRLICVDSTNRVEGIVSLSDILQSFL